MTTVKISDFNEHMGSLLHVKSEDESDEEQRPIQSTSGLGRDISNKKRYNLDNIDENNRPPAKKRYCFTE